jgi:hypothetical protein
MLDKVDSEGLEYAMIDYSSFAKIEDEEFHKRRKAFVKAANELSSYILEMGQKIGYERE